MHVIETVPFERVVVLKDWSNGAVVSWPISTDPTVKITRSTPVSSEALAEIVMLPDTVLSGAGKIIETVGFVVSGGGA